MTDKNTPAFPSGLIDPSTPDDAVHSLHNGMTLRQYIAIKAMPVIAAEIYSWKQTLSEPIPKITAKMAYEFADAMMEEGEK